jgi:hypothetical protein
MQQLSNGMAVYNINDFRKKEPEAPKRMMPKIDSKAFYSRFETIRKQTDRPGLLSSLLVRGFFILLLLADIIWIFYTTLMTVLGCLLKVITFGRIQWFNRLFDLEWKNLKRGTICFMALLIALFNPALGIMFSCLYFMMYDRTGIEEIVPSSLREQFKEYFP